MNWKKRKVSIVGAGAVGSTFAYALAKSGVAEEIAIIDQNKDLVKGQVLDLVHGAPFFPSVEIIIGDTKDYKDSSLIVITAGAKQKTGETRIDLLKRNAAIMEGIVSDIDNQNSQAVILVVSNPVDILTYVALKKLNCPKGRIIGSGTVLDSSRFRYLLSKYCKVDIHNVHAYTLGEHGDSEFAAWSMTHIAGMPIEHYCPLCAKCKNGAHERETIVDEVRNSAYHIIDYKGATCYAIGLALVRITESILRDQRSILTVSSYLKGEYGIDDVVLSVPSVVTKKGVERIVEGSLTEEEIKYLKSSADILKESIKNLY